MSQFVLHPEAYSDLNEIWEYIAVDSLDAADRVMDEIYKSINSLGRFPHQAHARPDLTSHGRRLARVQVKSCYTENISSRQRSRFPPFEKRKVCALS